MDATTGAINQMLDAIERLEKEMPIRRAGGVENDE
jgi:hypothetical protein